MDAVVLNRASKVVHLRAPGVVSNVRVKVTGAAAMLAYEMPKLVSFST